MGKENALSPRQVEVVRLISQGLSNREVADKLGCASTTVGVHLQAAYRKLRLHNRTQLAVWVVTGGLDGRSK